MQLEGTPKRLLADPPAFLINQGNAGSVAMPKQELHQRPSRVPRHVGHVGTKSLVHRRERVLVGDVDLDSLSAEVRHDQELADTIPADLID